MAGIANPSKPYGERTDLEKIQSQWNKLSGLHSREEWSAAVVRAATAAEIAANLAVRREFAARGEFEPEFVNKILKLANGLGGKVDRLLTPLYEHDVAKSEAMAELKVRADQINGRRNAVAHQGEFCNADEAQAAIA
ncbi:MAG: hypothetical protein AB7O44_30945 [Hyphomicrobiaceae bacterium]